MIKAICQKPTATKYGFRSSLVQPFRMSLFLIEGSCFTMLYWFLPYNILNQPSLYIHTYIYILYNIYTDNSSLLKSPSPPSIPPLWVITEYPAGFPALQSSSPLVICFRHDSVYVSTLLSPFIPPSPSPTVSTSPFSKSASPFLPSK